MENLNRHELYLKIRDIETKKKKNLCVKDLFRKDRIHEKIKIRKI